jgi:hypothetical protein
MSKLQFLNSETSEKSSSSSHVATAVPILSNITSMSQLPENRPNIIPLNPVKSASAASSTTAVVDRKKNNPIKKAGIEKAICVRCSEEAYGLMVNLFYDFIIIISSKRTN